MKELKILENVIRLFLPGPWPVRRPPEALILTSATSIGSQILTEDDSYHMKYRLLFKNINLEALDYIFQTVLPLNMDSEEMQDF